MNKSANETIINIDSLSYHTNFTGFQNTMNAYVANQPVVSFQPWQLGAHLLALSNCLIISANGLGLNHQAFSYQILLHNNIPESVHAVYAPLALWWASGGNTVPIIISADYYQLGNIRAKLRPWSCAERLLALAHCKKESKQGTDFELAAYLSMMINVCVVTIDNDLKLDEVDSASSCALLSAVIALNIRSANPVDESLLNSKEAAQLNLRLCRALGWTPSQIMATPAAEIDLIVALLDKLEGGKPTKSRMSASKLTAYPDAVVIQIEDD